VRHLFDTVPHVHVGTYKILFTQPGVLSLGVKRSGRDADHSPLSNSEVKNMWSFTSTPQYVLWRGAQLKHSDNFTFTFILCECVVLMRGIFYAARLSALDYSYEEGLKAYDKSSSS